MFTELNISRVKRACDHKRGGLPDGRLCGSYHERASLRSNEYCRRKSNSLVWQFQLAWYGKTQRSEPGGLSAPGSVTKTRIIRSTASRSGCLGTSRQA